MFDAVWLIRVKYGNFTNKDNNMHGKKLMLILISAVIYSGCKTAPANVNRAVPAKPQSKPAASEIIAVKAGSCSINMIQVAGGNLKYPLYVPYSEKENGTFSDKNINVLERAFMIAETELTNELALQILQWALKTGKLSFNPADHNGINSQWVKYGGRFIIDMRDKTSYIKYDSVKHKFSAAEGFEKYPFVNVTWTGAVMMCNWMTEMVYGGTSELVYSGMSSSWNPDNTKTDIKKKGFRLPEQSEYIFASRLAGRTRPKKGSLSKDYIACGFNGGMNILTEGFYWTPGRYASGSSEPYTNKTETLKYAVPSSVTPSITAAKAKNQLGLYDVSGNVDEWMNDYRKIYGSNFKTIGGGSDLERLQSAQTDYQSSAASGKKLGMRLAKTL